MERLLRPERLNVDPESSTAGKEWSHWFRTFQNFIATTRADDAAKLRLLINYLSADIYDYVSECGTYNDAIGVLRGIFVKPVNEVFARHKLATRKQQSGESISRYLESLRLLSKDCNFKAVTAETNRDDCIRDSFIAGLMDPQIRQRLLENPNLTLNDAFAQARALELAQQHSKEYQLYTTPLPVNAAASSEKQERRSVSSRSVSSGDSDDGEVAAAAGGSKCYFCGRGRHPRSKCPAKDSTCYECGKDGHFSRVCNQKRKSPRRKKGITSFIQPSPKCVASSSSCLSKALISVDVNGSKAQALIDTGSSSSFISEALARRLNIPISRGRGMEISMANTTLRTRTQGECKVDLQLSSHSHKAVRLNVLKDLCADLIIGHDILGRYSSLNMQFGGSEDPLDICALLAAKVEPACLFPNLKPGIRPICVKTRRHNDSDSKFIRGEIAKLVKDGIIEESHSPWRAQVLVVSGENHKRRMVIDYSQTINRFTELDAFPLPLIDELVQKVSQYRVFSTIDLRSAYHQIPIRPGDKPYTAFEACGRLYQFTRIPFGVTNGVAAFQRKMKQIIDDEKLDGTFAYLDDVTVCGHSQEDHDNNLRRFMAAAEKYKLTINMEKSSFSLDEIHYLGYVIGNRTLKPDPERLRPLRQLELPKDLPSLRRALGMFSHYSNFIPNFSDKIKVFKNPKFPLGPSAQLAFQHLKRDVENAVISTIDPSEMFTVETDASNRALAATLSQNGRPVAFFSRTLSPSEERHSAIEKEAHAIVEALRKWRHYLMGRHFKLITDQRSVSFMFSNTASSKIKNEKIQRWRLELSCFDYEIIYRPGKQNEAADAFSRQCSAVMDSTLKKLTDIHEKLCHPGETRMYHWIRSKNLAYTLEEVRKVISSCRVCSEVKPRFFRHQGQLIKATQPFERLNIDFKGPLPSRSKNKYLLIVVDEFSRYPFAFPCADLSSATVVSKLREIFCLFGTPGYIHSDRGTSFASQELKSFLDSLGIASSRTTPYNPRGNGQAEKYVGIVWKTVQLALRSRGLDITLWEHVVGDALNSIRSLLCTATNATPHERMFKHDRRSCHGSSTPSWLMTPGPVLMRRLVRHTKYDPLVDEVTLLQGNAEYAHVRLPDGRETTISTRHLAPLGRELTPIETTSDPTTDADPAPPVQEDDLPLAGGEQPQTPDRPAGDSHHQRPGPTLPSPSKTPSTPTSPQRLAQDSLRSPPPGSSRPSLEHGPPALRRSQRTIRRPAWTKDYETSFSIGRG